MQQEPQKDNTTRTDTKSVRVREDVWEAARTEAFQQRKNIVRVLDDALRAHFGLAPAPEESEDAA